MEKSGTRYPILKSPIIGHAGERQSPPQKLAYGAVTVIFWAFWIYLWVPLLALLAWLLGVQQAYKYMVVLGGYHEVIGLLAAYLLVILMLGGALLLWAGYNILRFSGVERRAPNPPVTAADIARIYNMDAAEIEGWQGARRLVVTHDEDGRIAAVDTQMHAGAVPVPG